MNVPRDSEQDEMQQVLVAVTNGAGLAAVAVTGGTPRREEGKEGRVISTAWTHISRESRAVHEELVQDAEG